MKAKNSIILIIGLLLGILLAACATADPGSTTIPPAQAHDTTAPVDDGILSGADGYRIVYAQDSDKYVKRACELLQETLGGIEMVSDAEPAAEYEILVGNTNRPESGPATEGLGAWDYAAHVEGDKLVLTGGSNLAVLHAVTAVARDDSIAADDSGAWVIPSDYSLYFDGAEDRQEYMADPDRFLVSWIYQFDVPDWMRDYEEKMAAFRDPDGRMMSSHHRGGKIYYPENSIETIISAIQMGADNIEIDVRITRDGVPVLMHDETLLATTDWSEKHGKDGLPDSDNVTDWSLEELRQLRLKTVDGKLTDYLIPTFEEALLVSKGRTTLRLDKTSNKEWESYIWPAIQRTEAWTTCILPDWYTMERKDEIFHMILEISGEKIMFYHSLYPDECEQWDAQIRLLLDKGYQPIMRWETFRTSGVDMRVEAVTPYLQQIRDMVRINADIQAMNQCKERMDVGDEVYEAGVEMMLIDNTLLVQQYIAENYEPTPYE